MASVTIYSSEWQIRGRTLFINPFTESTEISLCLLKLCLFSGLISYYLGGNKLLKRLTETIHITTLWQRQYYVLTKPLPFLPGKGSLPSLSAPRTMP